MSKARKPILPPGLLARPGAAPTANTPIQDLPRPDVAAPAPAASGDAGGGIKASTVGTTLYLLPEASKRLKRLAIDRNQSVHDMILDALDMLLTTQGEPPLKRYRPAKGKR